jgi:hypothetical protein
MGCVNPKVQLGDEPPKIISFQEWRPGIMMREEEEGMVPLRNSVPFVSSVNWKDFREQRIGPVLQLGRRI